MFYKLVGLRGPLALFLKYGFLGAADALLIWLISAAINKSSFIIAGVVTAALIFLNYSFITKGSILSRFDIFRNICGYANRLHNFDVYI